MTPQRWAGRVVIGLTMVWALLLLVVFALRLTFPLELEWMEDGALQQALRLQRGEPIYGPPAPDYVPYLYTPLYSVVLAGLGFVFPLDFALGRAVSITAVAATCVALWRLVGFEGKPRSHQAAAVGLFLSGYVFTFRWLDLARIDALLLALIVWALTLLREGEHSGRKIALAGLLMALAFWTKQTAFVFVLASGAVGLLVVARKLWIYVTVLGLFAGAGVLIGVALTDGWLWTYIYELHQAHAFNDERFRSKTWGMFAHAAPFLVLLTGLIAAKLAHNWVGMAASDREDIRARLQAARGPIYWAGLALAGLFVSALGYSTQWAEPNAFIPGVCLGAALFAVMLPVGGRWELAGLGLVAAQLLFSGFVEARYQPIQDRGLSALRESYAWQDPQRTIPSADQRKRAAALRKRIESTQGAVFALHRPWWNVIAGGGGHVGSMGINDVSDADASALRQALTDAVDEQRYAAIWLEGEPPGWLRRSLARGYRLDDRLQGKARVRPMTGYLSVAGTVRAARRDQLLFTPPSARPQPPGTTVIADFEGGRHEDWTIGGRSFGRGSVRSLHRELPAVGPIGGAYLLSSAATVSGVKGSGEASSPEFVLPAGGEVRVLLGAAGPREPLLVELVDQVGERRMRIDIPKGRFRLAPVSVPIPGDWAGATVHLRLDDQGDKSAVFLDDLWVVAP